MRCIIVCEMERTPPSQITEDSFPHVVDVTGATVAKRARGGNANGIAQIHEPIAIVGDSFRSKQNQMRKITL